MTGLGDGARLVVVVLVIVGAFVVFPLLFVGFGMMGVGPMMGGAWGGHMWGDGATPGWLVVLSLVMQLLFLASLVGAVYLAYRAVTSRESDGEEALEALRLAYARGDLTDDEYEQRREALERDTGSREN